MLFFGWGRKNIDRKISETQAILLSYRYFHLLFIFSATFSYTYKTATLSNDGWHYKDIAKDEALAQLGGQELKPNLWQRFSLLGFAVSFAIGIAMVNFL